MFTRTRTSQIARLRNAGYALLVTTTNVEAVDGSFIVAAELVVRLRQNVDDLASGDILIASAGQTKHKFFPGQEGICITTEGNAVDDRTLDRSQP